MHSPAGHGREHGFYHARGKKMEAKNMQRATLLVDEGGVTWLRQQPGIPVKTSVALETAWLRILDAPGTVVALDST